MRSGLPNQDAAQCVVIPGETVGTTVAVVAVSDGHGSARHFRSQVGSALASSTAVNVLQEFLRPYSERTGAISLDPAEVQQLQRRLVDAWMAAVASDLKNQPLTEEELARVAEEDGAESRAAVENFPLFAYGATLLVAAATESLLLYLQLGDGEILSVNSKGETTRPLPRDERLIGNATTSLCQPDAWQEFRSAWVTEPNLPALVLVSTDGYANSFRSDEDFLKIGSDYLEIIRDQSISVLAEDLPQILTEATQQGSGDDITLAILQGELRPKSAETGGGPVRPKLSPSSRSALIEQLKARHSSQQRRLDELSTRLEQTRKDNRRLQGLILLVILVVAGAVVLTFRDTIFYHPQNLPLIGSLFPHPKKPAPGSGGDSSGKDTKPTTVAVKEWTLKLKHGATLKLKKGFEIQAKQILPKGGDDLYARVLEQDGKIVLVNDSPDRWVVTPPSGRSYPVIGGDYMALGAEPVAISFAHGIDGKISAVSETAAAPAAAAPKIPKASPSSTPGIPPGTVPGSSVPSTTPPAAKPSPANPAATGTHALELQQ